MYMLVDKLLQKFVDLLLLKVYRLTQKLVHTSSFVGPVVFKKQILMCKQVYMFLIQVYKLLIQVHELYMVLVRLCSPVTE